MGKRLYFMSMLLLSTVLMFGCGKKAGNSEKTESSKQEVDDSEKNDSDSKKVAVEIEIKDHGTIKVELDAEQAPISVENFVTLAKDGFYDGLTFHRIIKGFMMQGGDPLGDGTGGAEKTIKGEFKKNGVENTLSHTRGAIAMARSMEMDSASSQFFIVHQDSVRLDTKYAAFGYVTEGMDIVDEICENAVELDANGTIAPDKKPVITSIKVID